MKKFFNIIIALLFGFVLGALIVHNLEQKPIKINAKEELKIKSIFSSGCEIGIMKYCEVHKQADCKRYCLLFLDANPDVLKMLGQGLRE